MQVVLERMVPVDDDDVHFALLDLVKVLAFKPEMLHLKILCIKDFLCPCEGFFLLLVFFLCIR